jgi:23S rRNA (adenine2503-C2)-methyltransferase
MKTGKPHLAGLSYEQVKELVASLGCKSYRADQLLAWVYQKSAADWEEMTDLPAGFRQQLAETVDLFTFTPREDRISADGKTRKMLFGLADGRTIESTLMYYENSNSGRERRTVCLSTQVGCAMGCLFCATGQQGFERNLEAGEIIEQVLFFNRSIKQEFSAEHRTFERNAITNVVFMGMGEPLANYASVRQAALILNSKHGLNLGTRQITLSTAGLVPQIRQLAEDGLNLELAISLHAANNELRDRLMPINRKFPLDVLIPACREYFDRTGRRPTFEYALFQGVNDTPEAARQLVARLKGLNCAVNLIVGNATACPDCRPSTLAQAVDFQKQLFDGGIFNTIRVSKGTDIEAGCGQLRSRYLSNQTASG